MLNKRPTEEDMRLDKERDILLLETIKHQSYKSKSTSPDIDLK